MVRLTTDGSAIYFNWNLPCLSSGVSTKNCGQGYTGICDVDNPWLDSWALTEIETLSTVSDPGADDGLSNMAFFLIGSYLTFQAFVWTSSRSLINASVDAIITAIIFLTVGLNPNPVALSSIFLAKSADKIPSTSESFAFVWVSMLVTFLSNFFSPSNIKNFGNITFFGTPFLSVSTFGTNCLIIFVVIIEICSVVGDTVPVWYLIVCTQSISELFTSIKKPSYFIGFSIGDVPLIVPSVGFSANAKLYLATKSDNLDNASSFAALSKFSLNAYTNCPTFNIIGLILQYVLNQDVLEPLTFAK